MNNLFSAFKKLMTRLVARLTDKNNPATPTCQFCGARDHDAEHCPNAAKYKLFHIDRE